MIICVQKKGKLCSWGWLGWDYWHQANFCAAISFVSKQMNAGDDFECRPVNYYSLRILLLVSFLISTGTGCSSSYDPAQFFLCFIRQSAVLSSLQRYDGWCTDSQKELKSGHNAQLSFQCLRIKVYMIIEFVLLEKQYLECVQKDRQILIWSFKNKQTNKPTLNYVCLLVCASGKPFSQKKCIVNYSAEPKNGLGFGILKLYIQTVFFWNPDLESTGNAE